MSSGFQIDTGPLWTSLRVTIQQSTQAPWQEPWNGVSGGVWYYNSFKCCALTGVKCLVLAGAPREGKMPPSPPALWCKTREKWAIILPLLGSAQLCTGSSQASVPWLRDKTNAIEMENVGWDKLSSSPVASQKPNIWTVHSYSIGSLRFISSINLSVINQRESH